MWPASRGEAVGDVEHRVRGAGEAAALVEPQRRPRVPLPAEGRARGAERAGHDEQVAGLRARAAGDALGAAERRDGEDELRRAWSCRRRRPARRLVQPLVELEHVVELRVRGTRRG